MKRPFALLLIVVGGLLAFVGVLGLVATLAGNGPVNADTAVGFAVFAIFGAMLLVPGVVLLRRSRTPGGMAYPGGGGRYPAGVVRTEELGGREFDTLYTPPTKGKNARPSNLRVSVPVPPATVAFRVARETGFDRWAKRVGLAAEIETGDAEFDPACYVRTADPDAAAAALADPARRAAVLALRAAGFAEVRVGGGRAAAEWPGFDPAAHDRDDLLPETAARLCVLADDLPDASPDAGRASGGRRALQVALWLGLVAFGALSLVAVAFPPVSTGTLLAASLLVSIPGYPLFAVASGLLLRGTSTSHDRWKGLAIGAVVAVPLGGVGAVGVFNGADDPSAPVVRRLAVRDKVTTRSKNSTNHYVVCESWREPGRTERWSVSASEFGRVEPGRTEFEVTTRAGRLGIEWVDGKRLLQPPAPALRPRAKGR